jgi:glycosyltransferase involved in cell wall biosynthesis
MNNNKLDITVVILTYNEDIHILRCIENAKKYAKDIFIVDSYSTDRTIEIASTMGVKVYQNKWENNHAKQFNWGLDNCPISTDWVLRLDADEYLTDELIHELYEKLPLLDVTISGIEIPLKRIFMGRHLKRGVGLITQMRIFRYRKARCEIRQMDEHIELLEGESVRFRGAWVDDNLNNIGWWTAKHNSYAAREAVDLLDIEFDLTGNSGVDNNRNISVEAKRKRMKKHRYVKMPLFWRSFFYFLMRYFFKGGFLEGKEGFLWHCLQGWWYRTLVDAKVYEIKKACGSDKNRIKEYISRNYGISL